MARHEAAAARRASIARGEGEGNGGPRKSGAALISTGEIHTLDKTRTDERAEGKRMTMKPRDTRSISFSPSPLSLFVRGKG